MIKQRAREKDPGLFYEIEHFDLIAKNVWFSEHCRKDFTRPKKSSNPVNCVFLQKHCTKYKLHLHSSRVESEGGTFLRLQELKLTKSPSRNYGHFSKKKQWNAINKVQVLVNFVPARLSFFLSLHNWRLENSLCLCSLSLHFPLNRI